MATTRKEPESHSRAAPDLSGITLFDGLAAQALREVASRALVRKFAPDEVLWRAGAQPGAMHVVLEGEVRVVRASGGRQRVVHVERRGGTLGDVALFAEIPFPATAIAASRVTTLALTRDAIHAIVAADPRFAERLLRGVAQRVRQLIERLDQLTAHTVTTRLARYLLQRAQDRDVFTLGMTQQQLAEELGTVREVVVRGLRELREAGTIETAGRARYRILDRSALTQTAAGASGENQGKPAEG